MIKQIELPSLPDYVERFVDCFDTSAERANETSKFTLGDWYFFERTIIDADGLKVRVLLEQIVDRSQKFSLEDSVKTLEYICDPTGMANLLKLTKALIYGYAKEK